MAISKINLTKALADDLSAVCDLSGARLSRIAEILEQESTILKRTALQTKIGSEIGQESAKTVARVLLGLASISRDGASSPADVVTELTKQIIDKKFDRPTLTQWNECKGALERLVGSSAVLFTAKAIDLGYDFGHIFLTSRILTDIRPVFDEPRAAIVGAAITQTLRLEYLSREGDRSSITLTMDTKDIERLRKACDTALKKAVVAKEFVEKKGEIQAISIGEDLSDDRA